MIERALSGEGEGVDSQALYSAFYKGLPVEKLRPLLTSPLPKARALGSYLAYELEHAMHPLVPELSALLEDEDAQVRADALMALRSCTGPGDGEALGRCVLLLADESPFVQKIAMRHIEFCDRWQINLGVNEAAEIHPGTVFEELPRFVGKRFGTYLRISEALLRMMIRHEDPVVKRLAVGLAARPVERIDAAHLRIARMWKDEQARRVIVDAADRALHGRSALLG